MEKIKVRDQRKKRFFTVDNEAVLLKAREIGTTALAVYINLIFHSDKNQESFPSQQTIADELGISRDTVIEKIKVLENHNMIHVSQSREEGTGVFLHNVYSLLDKTVWINSDMEPSRKNTIRVEADTVSGNSDTNNTHVLTKPIEKFGKKDLKLRPDFEEHLSRKRERKTRIKTPFTGSKPVQYPQNPQPKKRHVDLTNIA